MITTKELDAMRYMWGRGLTVAEIAEALGRSKRGVWEYIRRHRDLFPMRRHNIGWWKERLYPYRFMTAGKAARALGVSESCVSRWRGEIGGDYGR